MPAKPFFEDAESSHFDAGSMPIRPGIYEFRRYDGRKILYTLAFMETETEKAGEADEAAGDGTGSAKEAPRLKVTHASRMADYPYPAHALDTLDGDWVRFVGLPGQDGDPGAAPDQTQA